MFVAVLGGAVVLMTDLFFRVVWGAIKSRMWLRVRGKNAVAGALTMLGFLLFLLAVAAVLRLFAPLATRLVQALVSREREYLADATSAEITRNPDGLERALSRIEHSRQRLDIKNRAIQHLFIANPTRDREPANSLFATHPPILERVNRLRHLQAEEPIETIPDTGEPADQEDSESRAARRRRYRRQRKAT